MTELTGVGLSNEALSRSRRKLLDLINRLHSTGAQVDVDLPQIAVIGSQSAGKSSLIEFISGITLPRASGTCTRGRSSVNPKTNIEERIRRAQFAILNPSTSPDHFLTGDHNEPGDTELTFTTNCVSLSISGPDVADLSFCDLPADFENQGAHHLAKKHDPKGKRTIGVLTKPDRIPIGDEESWMRFIKNEKEPLENNWYCVKQHSPADLQEGVLEDDWFSMTAPWSTMDPFYKRYLRTTNLVERLSANLSELLKRRVFLTKTGSRPHQEKFRKRVQDTAPVVMPVERKRAKGMKLPIFEFLAQEEEKKGGGPEKEGEAGKVEVGRSRGNVNNGTQTPASGTITASFIAAFHKTWLEPAIGLCNDTYKILLNHVDDLITSNFGDVGEGLLEQHIG
ncbi:P-loop containing nucleoside triphosphate hydrolase protein [Mucidula mucida]|nr:P-loop containing nucleoside triphosphate hydrolase protein [Mucidula mucida]